MEEKEREGESLCLVEDKVRGIMGSMNRVLVEDCRRKFCFVRKWKYINDGIEDCLIGFYSIVVCKYDF